MRSRIPAALVLALLTAAASGQAPAQPDPKDPPKGPTKLPEPKWPTEIGGKNLKAWLKDVIDPDPAVREAALRTLPNFGPDVRKEAGKILVARMAGGEKDPGVRVTLMNTIATVGFDAAAEETEALRLLGLTIDQGQDGGVGRLTAVQAIAAFGPKAERQIELVAGRSLHDASYATRQSIARTLGVIGFNEKFGPNRVALNRLAATLARDSCVAVRMEALQSLVVLGPPWAEPRKPNEKTPPKLDKGAAKSVADFMRERLGLIKAKSVALEPDAQLQIWCRVVLMRFDPEEITDANLSAISRHTAAPEAGPKVQALQALALFGEQAGSQVDAVVRVLDDTDPQVLGLGISALASMGVKATGAVAELEKLEKKLAQMREDQLKKPEVLKVFAELKPEEQTRVRDSLQEEQMRKAVVEAIKWIKDSKPGLPGGDRPASGGAATPEPKKG